MELSLKGDMIMATATAAKPFVKPKKVTLPQPKIGPDGKKQWAELFAGMKDDALLEYAIGSMQNDMMAFKQIASVELRKRNFKLAK